MAVLILEKYLWLQALFMEYYRDDKLLKALGMHIRRLRVERGLSQEAVANELGSTQTHIARIEGGKVNTSVSHVAAIAKVLQVALPSLFDF